MSVRVIIALAIAFGAAVGASGIAHSQGATTFGVPSVTGTGGLRTVQNISAGTYVYVAGYHTSQDGGGGWYLAGTAACLPGSANGATWSAGNPVVSATSVTGLTAGMAISMAAAGIQVYDTIVNIIHGTSSYSITLAVAPTQPQTSGTTLQFSQDNAGSMIEGAGSGLCFTKTTFTYNPIEWGAYEDYSPTAQTIHDDTIALGNWMNASWSWVNPGQTNLMPHVAIPGNSLITAPLICNDGGIIQGAPSAAATDSGALLPMFNIYALAPNDPNYPFHAVTPNSAAMLIMAQYQAGSTTQQARCAIHSLGLIGGDPTGSYDAIDANGVGDLIDQHSYISGGCYNVRAAGSVVNLELYDSTFRNSVSDNVNMFSSNSRVVRNTFAGAGTGLPTQTGCMSSPASGNGISFGATDVVISNNTFEQEQGWGIQVNAARQLRIAANYFFDNGLSLDSNGKAIGDIKIYGSGLLSICGNTFNTAGSGGEGHAGLTTSHVFFGGQDDSVSLCGNTYLASVAPNNYPAGTIAPSVSIGPDYDYDAGAGATLTNISIADNPEPQNIGVYSPAAQSLLNSGNIAQQPQNYLSGLTLSNDSPSSLKVDIAAGAATDSTGSTMLAWSSSSPCQVDLAGSNPTNGLGRLDVSSVAATKTYFFFLVSAANGANPNCMASASPTPSFINTPYTLTTTGTTSPGSNLITYVGGPTTQGSSAGQLASNPLAGMAVGDTITSQSGDIPPGTTIASLTAFNKQDSGSTSTNCLYGLMNTTGLLPGMLVSGANILSGTYITQIVNCRPGGGNSVTLSQPVNTPASGPVTFAGNYTITLTNAIVSTAAQVDTLSVYHGLYRMLGALYTTSTPTVVNFKQDNDTFYLASSVTDIQTSAPQICPVGTSATTCQLSVPCGRQSNACPALGTAFPKMEALGRIVGGDNGTYLLLSSLAQSDQNPNQFPGPPGYTTSASNTSTAYPFRLYTDQAGGVRVRVSGSTANVYEVTDGWIFHRMQ